MLKEILAEFDRVDAPLDLNELSERLNIQKSALQGMIITLVNQGKLNTDADAGSSQGEVSCGGVQCMGCSAASNCPFIGKMPTSYTKAKGLPPQGSRTQR
jgi:hypothetical protein